MELLSTDGALAITEHDTVESSTLKLLVRGGIRIGSLIERHGAQSKDVAEALERWSRIIRSNAKTVGVRAPF